MKSYFMKFAVLMLFVSLLSGTVYGQDDSEKQVPVTVGSEKDMIGGGIYQDDPFAHGDIWTEMDRMHQRMNQIFKSSFMRNPMHVGRVSQGSGLKNGMDLQSSSDVYETPTEIIVTCDVPGIEKSDLNIDIKKNLLTISGVRKNERMQQKQSDGYQYHFQERSYGGFERQFVLPENIDVKSARAEHENGVLQIRFRKIQDEDSISIPIQ